MAVTVGNGYGCQGRVTKGLRDIAVRIEKKVSRVRKRPRAYLKVHE